ncbi:MAG: phytanoyl-CoA dioxygenase family protein [Rhizobiaceae bacterium]
MTVITELGTDQIDEALRWAGRKFRFRNSKRITNHPWGKTYALHGIDQTTYLKIVPSHGADARFALEAISRQFANQVPELIACDSERGFFLYSDFQADPIESGLNSSQRRSILRTYASIQSAATSETQQFQDLPQVKCSDQFEQLMAFLGNSDALSVSIDGRPSAGFFIGDDNARHYRDILYSLAKLFERFLALGDTVPVTLNHCDLRTKNMARRADGSLVIYDWDDAVIGPPGLSLHALFSGSFRPIAALSRRIAPGEEPRLARDRAVVDHYIEGLCASQTYKADELRIALPATSCAGVIHYLLGFANYPVSDNALRHTIGKNMTRRFSDLLNVAHILALHGTSRETQEAFSAALRASGRSARADHFDKAAKVRMSVSSKHRQDGSSNQINSEVWLQQKLEASDGEGVFPSVAISVQEQASQKLSDSNLKLGVELFKRHGTLMIENAIPPDLVQRCHREFMNSYERYFHDTRHDDALRVGDKRFMITVEFSGGFAKPKMFASPMVMPIMAELLSSDFILGSLTAVASLPGSSVQRMHKDNQALFPETPDGALPSFSIAMIVPLIALNEETGATRVVKGSHRFSSSESKKMPYQDPTVSLGSCFLMDSRLTHQGMGNNSQFVRPITSLVYQRPWYQDNLNYKKQKPLNINAQQFEAVPDNLTKLVEWAVSDEHDPENRP